MSGMDDLQELWRGEGGNREEPKMWRDLIQEKRTGWRELVKAEDQSWYLIALCLAVLTAWAAWKTAYPWVRVGYGLMAVAIGVSALATWLAGRRQAPNGDRSLREDLEMLIESYDRRIRFIRNWGWPVMLALSAGVIAIVMGIPRTQANPWAWATAAILVAGANVGQWLYGKQNAEKIGRKRKEAVSLLQSLLSDPQRSC